MNTWKSTVLFIFFGLLKFLGASNVEELCIKRESSSGSVFADFPESPLSMRTPTPQAVSFALQTARLEIQSILHVLFSIPEFQARLVDKFTSFYLESGEPAFTGSLWPALVSYLALVRSGSRDPTLITKLIVPLLEAKYESSFASSESLLDVMDNFVMTLPGAVQEIFFYPPPENHYLKTIHMDSSAEDMFLDLLAHMERFLHWKTAPNIMTVGLKRHNADTSFNSNIIKLPVELVIHGLVYEKVGVIFPTDPSNPESPFSSWVKNSVNNDLESSPFVVDSFVESHNSPFDEDDQQSVLVFYRLMPQNTHYSIHDITIPDELFAFALKYKRMFEHPLETVDAEIPIRSTVIEAGTFTAFVSILTCFIGHRFLASTIPDWEGSSIPQMRAMYEFYSAVFAGQNIKFYESSIIRVAYDSIPTEMSFNIFSLWKQLAQFFLPFEMEIVTEFGRISEQMFVTDEVHETNLVVIAPNDCIGVEWKNFGNGREAVLTIAFGPLQTLVHPKGQMFAFGVNRIPISGETLADRLTIDNLNNELADVFAFVCFDVVRSEYYSYFVVSGDTTWNWARFRSNEPIELLPRTSEVQEEIMHDLATNSVLILFRSLSSHLEDPNVSSSESSSSYSSDVEEDEAEIDEAIGYEVKDDSNMILK